MTPQMRQSGSGENVTDRRQYVTLADARYMARQEVQDA